jgi:hypothetical protein
LQYSSQLKIIGMKKIKSNLKLNAKGPDVADLHSSLQLFIKKEAIPGKMQPTNKKFEKRKYFTAELNEEINKETFGPATEEWLKKFQDERGLEVTGVVNTATAEYLNVLLQKEKWDENMDLLGSLQTKSDKTYKAIENITTGIGDVNKNLESNKEAVEMIKGSLESQNKKIIENIITQNESLESLSSLSGIDKNLKASTDALGKIGDHISGISEIGKLYFVSGFICSEAEKPLEGYHIQVYQQNTEKYGKTKKGIVKLGEDFSDKNGNYSIQYKYLPDISNQIIVVAFDSKNNPVINPKIITKPSSSEIVNFKIAKIFKPKAPEVQWFEGRVIFEDGTIAKDLSLKIVFRYTSNSSIKEYKQLPITSDANGEFTAKCEVDGKLISYEILTSKDKSIIRKRLLNPGKTVKLNLTVPDDLKIEPVEFEFERLGRDINPHKGHLELLKKEVDKQANDQVSALFSELNEATGWDARLIALYVMAERLVADNNIKNLFSKEEIYGLLRVGLPSDKEMLAQIDFASIEKALKYANKLKIIKSSNIIVLQDKYSKFIGNKRLDMKIPGSESTYGDFLDGANLSDDGKKKIKNMLNSSGGKVDLSKNLEDGLSPDDINKLKLQAKFAYLTGYSADMTKWLLEKEKSAPIDFVDKQFYKTETWKTELKKVLKELEPDILIPSAYGEGNIEESLHAYAEDMARKIRISYPTHVVANMIIEQSLSSNHIDSKTGNSLKEAANLGFRLGETPITPFFKTNEKKLNTDNATIQQIKMLQRVYQITPTNEAMSVLMELGLTSAYNVINYSEEDFSKLYKKKHKECDEEESKQIYSKAKQVNSVALNLFAMVGKSNSQYLINAISGKERYFDNDENIKDSIKYYPSMETLFGSMDYCECEHCRSVLSPAAYLVDLLQFIEPKKIYEDKPDKKPPYDVLLKRRPDIPHIQLNCVNTNTTMPYIDLVNEILEYYVANKKLEKEAAYDTGEATTAELLAEPQNVIVEAYKKLSEASYPLELPFDLPIEIIREFCNYFGTPLELLLDKFNSCKEGNCEAFYFESLGLSPAEVALFTNNPPFKWYELFGFEKERDTITRPTKDIKAPRTDLNSAKVLSHYLGVTYKELTEIVQTNFINPELNKVSFIYKMGVSIHCARFYLDHKEDPIPVTAEKKKINLEVKAFEEKLEEFARTFNLTKNKLEKEIKDIPFNKILLLTDTNTRCNFDQTNLQYADGSDAKPIDFLRINLFVRLWRKLGWSIEETDRSLCTFIPDTVLLDANEFPKRFKTALIDLALLKALNNKLKLGRQGLLKILALWSNISTTGKNSIYEQLFLKRTLLNSSAVFDHSLGQYLTDATIKLMDNVLTIQGALGFTAGEINLILRDNEKVFNEAKLSLENVSLLFRYRLLSKALKLSINELISLKQISGINPFKLLNEDNTEFNSQENPLSQTLEFVTIVEEFRDIGLKIEDLDYFLRHKFDETGKYRIDQEGSLSMIKTLGEGVRAIQAEHALPDDPSAITEEVLRQKLGLVLSSDVVERFLGLLNNTVEFTATKIGVEDNNILKSETFKSEKRIREINYKEVPNKELRMTVQGVLSDSQIEAMKNRFAQDLNETQKTVFNELLSNVQKLAREFYDNHLKKQILRPNLETGFLNDNDFEKLFGPLDSPQQILSEDSEDKFDTKQKEDEIVKKNQEELQKRLYSIAEAFLPYLQQRLIRQFIVQMMTAQMDVDPIMVESFINDERILAAPNTLLDNFIASSEHGLNATFNTSADAEKALPKIILYDADTGFTDKEGNLLMPAKTDSAYFEAYFEIPATGAYRFYLELENKGAEAELCFRHLAKPSFLEGKAYSEHYFLGDKPDEYLELKVGLLYHVSLNIKSLSGGNAKLLVQGEALPKGPISQLKFYPASLIEAAERAMTLLSKAVQLVKSLELNEREIRYLLNQPEDFDNFSLSELPTTKVSNSNDEKDALKLRFIGFRRLAAYARLKRDLAGETDDLIAIFEANGSDDRDKVYTLLAKLTRNDEHSIKETANGLFDKLDFNNEKSVEQLWNALQIVSRFGINPSSLIKVKSIDNALNFDQRFEIARDLQKAIQSRFEPETWQRITRPIFNKLRQRQRDALASHVMHIEKLDSMGQLYEHFLVDPGMEPIVQTSRIRLAIGSVQLFIQRCLLNMEKDVSPSSINSKQWEWMKRYRVWEANRKIFLFPENWLEPEFRDDKTHLFTELEGALLQGDVSSDLVEDALLNYLKKLDEIARLDIVAMHIEDNAHRTLHVFGRTYNQPHKYFYRRYLNQMWTPWEPVSAQIEGDHLAPVVWRDRLYLFWVTIANIQEKKQDGENRDTGEEDGGQESKELTQLSINDVTSWYEKKVQIQLHWSEYLGGQWSTKEYGGNFNSDYIGGGPDSKFKPEDVFIFVFKEFNDDVEAGVYINLSGSIDKSFYLAGRNSIVELKGNEVKHYNPFECASDPEITGYSSKNPFYKKEGKIILDLKKSVDEYTIITNNSETIPEDETIPSKIKNDPIFYKDAHHTFFIEDKLKLNWIPPSYSIETPIDTSNSIFQPPIWEIQGFLYEKESGIDPISNPITIISFDNILIGPNGATGLRISEKASIKDGFNALPVKKTKGETLPANSPVEIADNQAYQQSGMDQVTGGLNIIGSRGLTSQLMNKLNKNILR